MTSLEKMFKRLQVENENSVRGLTGKPLLTIPVELMTEDEYKAYMKTKVKTPVETKKEEVKVNPVNKPAEIKKVELKKVEVKTVKATPIKPVEAKEVKFTPEVKATPVETKKVEEVKVIESVDSLKSTVNFVKDRLEKLSMNVDNVPVEEKEVVQEIKNGEEAKEVQQQSTEIDETTQKKVELVKSKIEKIVKEATSGKINKPLIEDYRKLTSSKKKIAIADMIKSLANEVAKENQCDISEVLNFATNITAIANQNNKREYNSMINALKETLSKMKKSNLIDGIIAKLDKELKNIILLNKTKFVTFIKNMNTDLELTDENLDKVSAELDSITSRLNNGEDFDKINKSFGDKVNSEDNHIEAKVVDNDENNTEEPNDENIISEVDSAENVFLTMDEVDSLASTMNEVLMGI